MSDDLVKRLRRLDTCIFPIERDRCACGEAADYIQTLEKALREIASLGFWDGDQAGGIARAALGEKKDV